MLDVTPEDNGYYLVEADRDGGNNSVTVSVDIMKSDNSDSIPRFWCHYNKLMGMKQG